MKAIDTYKAYQFNRTADFGTSESYVNGAGVSVSKFAKQFSLHYAIKKKTIDQQYQAINTRFEDTIILIVRHDNRLSTSLMCQISGSDYDIVDISQDDSMYISYDLVTVKQIKKAGASS